VPELPEVETVRRGLARTLPGRTLVTTDVRHARAVRRQPGGAAEFAARMRNRRVESVERRGKYLWLVLDDAGEALVAHLGMSGQFRLLDEPAEAVGDPHLRVTWQLDDGRVLAFRDQRTFGWVLADSPDRTGVPGVVAHVAVDPFDARYDAAAVLAGIRRSRSGIKRILLAQTVVSGIGNIYADEALWRAGIHPEHPGNRLSRRRASAVLEAAREVMASALEAGGTSFDPLYVAVNGESGWFERSLAVYGREGLPCPRCGGPIVRERFTNRSSHRCPRCQRASAGPAHRASAVGPAGKPRRSGAGR
jgi:formamidopyrimidine-DNA glycosylase